MNFAGPHNYVVICMLPFKAKRVIDKNFAIIDFLFFTDASTTFNFAFNGVILFEKFNQLLIKYKFKNWYNI